MAALRRSFVSFVALALFALPAFAFAQVYGGGNYGGGDFNVGDVQVSTGNVSVSSGGGQVVGSSPTAPGYVNTNPTGQSASVANASATTTASTTSTAPATSASGGSSLTEAQIQSILSILQSFGADQSVVDSVNASLRGSAPAGGSSSSFTRDLQLGDEGDDVKALQQYLNTHGYVLTESGGGSPGNETTKFGGLTQAALIKFQTDHDITPAAGYFGPKTRAVIGG